MVVTVFLKCGGDKKKVIVPMFLQKASMTLTYLQPVRMMLGISLIALNTNIDSNDLHDCVK